MNNEIEGAIKLLVENAKDSNYIKFAKREFDIAWPEMDEMQKHMCDQIIEILSILDTQGDSGTSIGYKLNLLKKLIMFEPISPLTFKDDEWNKTSIKDICYQNKRNSAVFKDEKGISFLYGFVHRDKYIVTPDNICESEYSNCWNGNINVIQNDGKIYSISTAYIKDLLNFNGKKYIIDCYAIEHPEDWWLSFCFEDDLKELYNDYTFEKDYSSIEDELNFKEGIYKEDYLKMIEDIKNYNKNDKSKI